MNIALKGIIEYNDDIIYNGAEIVMVSYKIGYKIRTSRERCMFLGLLFDCYCQRLDIMRSSNLCCIFTEVEFMGQKVKNELNNVSIGGSYIGGNNVVNNYYGYQVERETEESKGDKTIFLSYNWHDGEIADRIDKHLSGLPGLTVKRDVRDIGSWKSIREFMEGIRQQDYAVLIVSDSYLKSKNCMFEVTEMMKEQEYADRIFPAVAETSIYDPLVRTEYIRYWQQECDKLEAAVKGLDPANAVELAADLKRYKNIASCVGEFLSIVADKNNPNIQDVEVQIEKAVLKSWLIRERNYCGSQNR